MDTERQDGDYWLIQSGLPLFKKSIKEYAWSQKEEDWMKQRHSLNSIELPIKT